VVHWSFWAGLPVAAAGWVLVLATGWLPFGLLVLVGGVVLLVLGRVVLRPYRPADAAPKHD
jgi:membrane-bound ClpP family serine protease